MSCPGRSTTPRSRQQRSVLRLGLHVGQAEHSHMVLVHSMTQSRLEHIQYVNDVAFLRVISKHALYELYVQRRRRETLLLTC